MATEASKPASLLVTVGPEQIHGYPTPSLSNVSTMRITIGGSYKALSYVQLYS